VPIRSPCGPRDDPGPLLSQTDLAPCASFSGPSSWCSGARIWRPPFRPRTHRHPIPPADPSPMPEYLVRLAKDADLYARDRNGGITAAMAEDVAGANLPEFRRQGGARRSDRRRTPHHPDCEVRETSRASSSEPEVASASHLRSLSLPKRTAQSEQVSVPFSVHWSGSPSHSNRIPICGPGADPQVKHVWPPLLRQ
jgi:hypothetical protein